jgi:hypothetical protein
LKFEVVGPAGRRGGGSPDGLKKIPPKPIYENDMKNYERRTVQSGTAQFILMHIIAHHTQEVPFSANPPIHRHPSIPVLEFSCLQSIQILVGSIEHRKCSARKIFKGAITTR